MSEQRDLEPAEAFVIIALAIFLFLAFLNFNGQIRDLQRRVGQLEQRVK